MDPRRETRRLAMQVLYAIDLGRLGRVRAEPRGEGPEAESCPDSGVLLEAIDAEFNADPGVRHAAVELALAAWRARGKSDALCATLAPDWPPSRQPPVDRAILRLALCEIATGRTPMKVAVNEAVELAKKFAGEDSPSFVNGLLDKAARQLPPPPHADPTRPEDLDAKPDPVDPHAWLDQALKTKA